MRMKMLSFTKSQSRSYQKNKFILYCSIISCIVMSNRYFLQIKWFLRDDTLTTKVLDKKKINNNNKENVDSFSIPCIAC
jgi:hypothetical protein